MIPEPPYIYNGKEYGLVSEWEETGSVFLRLRGFDDPTDEIIIKDGEVWQQS